MGCRWNLLIYYKSVVHLFKAKTEGFFYYKHSHTSHAKASTHTLPRSFNVGMTNCTITRDISCIGEEMSEQRLLIAEIIQGSLTSVGKTEKQTPPLIDESELKEQQEESQSWASSLWLHLCYSATCW